MTDRALADPGVAVQTVACPICLSELRWDELQAYTRDSQSRSLRLVEVPPGASVAQRRRAEQSAVVICPNTSEGEHTLPIEYGRHGRPVVIGLVGRSAAGKTHLLSALVQALEDKVEMLGLGVERCFPVDLPRHRDFLDQRVLPLFAEGRVIPGTGEGIVSFADAFVIGPAGRERVVAIFDVAGGDLQRVENHRQFLYLADGLLFVADPAALESHEGAVTGDLAFGAVLDLIGADSGGKRVAAAIALAKADRLRFEEPIDYWMRQPVSLDPQVVWSESRDMYAYLSSRGGRSWLRPFVEWPGATLHAVSATGGSSQVVRGEEIFPRGVRSSRVLGPFVALLIMTGVLEGRWIADQSR